MRSSQRIIEVRPCLHPVECNSNINFCSLFSWGKYLALVKASLCFLVALKWISMLKLCAVKPKQYVWRSQNSPYSWGTTAELDSSLWAIHIRVVTWPTLNLNKIDYSCFRVIISNIQGFSFILMSVSLPQWWLSIWPADESWGEKKKSQVANSQRRIFHQPAVGGATRQSHSSTNMCCECSVTVAEQTKKRLMTTDDETSTTNANSKASHRRCCLALWCNDSLPPQVSQQRQKQGSSWLLL